MTTVADRYQALLGRPPSRREADNLERIARALGIRDNDAIWTVLIALEDYEQRYRLAPARIEKAINTALASVKHAAEHETQVAAARAVQSMANEAGRIGQQIAAQTAGRDRARWMSIMAAVCTAALLATGAGAFYVGHQTGAAATTDAAAWAISHEGQRARAFARTGSLTVLSSCLGDGWRVENLEGRLVCRPSLGSGWYLP